MPEDTIKISSTETVRGVVLEEHGELRETREFTVVEQGVMKRLVLQVARGRIMRMDAKPGLERFGGGA